jgi:acetyl-CoA carboxylase biotin carboxylase subunit
MPFKRILIANRGEIALRIIRACKEMGIETIAVYSDADKDSLPVKAADQAVHIGPALSYKSYLNLDKIMTAAREAKADAVHPGYGFLSENAAFAKACEDTGIKSSARRTLTDLGIPVIPGSLDILTSPDIACALAETVGFPVILKASGGGGGRGMRIAHNPKELREAFSMASGEAKAAFGNPDIYLEKYITNPRHIEIQILGDKFGHYVHLAERECSIQKRYQKLIEEAPSSFVDEDLRAALGNTAITIARALGYTNAGTIEFLVDKDKKFYFMEVNARVQVEHPVTEMITGIDIVRQQILIAAGQKLALKQEDIVPNGWAMECRINASDPDDNFMPCPGRIESIVFPGGPGVRMDTHIHDGYMVGPFYDSLIGKLIVWDQDRPSAIRRMKRALDEFDIKGIQTTIPFFRNIFLNKNFQKGNIDTHFLENI